MFNRLNCMRLVLSNSTMLRRMNDFAKLHDKKLLLYKGKSVVQANQSTPNPGKTFVIDNLDLRQKVSNMTEENQNDFASYLILQVKAILSPKQAYRLLWNRKIRCKNCNIPYDLDLEHDNRMAKEAIKNLGPNITDKSVTRIIKAQQTARQMLDSFDKSMDIMRRSGRHTRQSDEEDFETIVDRLMEQQALTRLPEGRVYNHYNSCKSSVINNLNVHSFMHGLKNIKKIFVFVGNFQKSR